ncbi:hypothetical protein QBC47DRAFT_383796 [Echria macrotheca]|uniref:Bromo domain-containing protein n=1 Tax=Echria macrotheca TaxID=438768 RepID=A0AAJ0BCR6_9PEZI|nr:hypothetical protein QBC47DRAFT_383796 [Echria macrotheca]
MNIPSPYTALECLLLFRGVSAYGLDEKAFNTISEGLTDSELVKDGSTYNPARLTSAGLRELFLDLLWEEIKASSADNAPRPDGGSPPASKKRRLQPPPRPTVQDALQCVDKIRSGHEKLWGVYSRQMVEDIRQLEEDWLQTQKDIEALQALDSKDAQAEQPRTQPDSGRIASGQGNSVGDVARRSLEPVQPGSSVGHTPNGVGPTQAAPATRPISPRPPPLPQAPSLPSAVTPVVSARPQPPQPPQQIKPGANQARPTPPAVPGPVLAQPQAVPQPLLGTSRVQDTAKPPSGASPGLQLPQGLPVFQPAPIPSQGLSPAPQPPSEGLQRPADAARPKQMPSPTPGSQAPAQGQLRWEPPYQPNSSAIRPPPGPQATQPGDAANQFPQAPAQRVPVPHPPQPISRPLQPQAAKPLPQPVPQPGLVPPQNAGQYPPPQPVPIRSSTDSGGPVRQPLLAPNVQPNRAPVPAFHGYPPQSRTPGSAPTPPGAVAARPQPGLGQPQPPRPVSQALQAPPYNQTGTPAASPALGLVQETQRGYSSPYPAQVPTIPGRVQQQRLPSTPTPTPPARLTPLTFPPPQTPAAFLPRLLTGSGTKWATSSTPSTPTAASLIRAADDVPDSPGCEPLSPIPRPQALPRGENAPQHDVLAPEQSVDTTPAKRKGGRPRGSQRTDDSAPARPGLSNSAVPPPKVASTSQPAPAESHPGQSDHRQPSKEPESAMIKDEVMTPLPLTEAGDTTADESVTGRRQKTRRGKRKREELSPTPAETPVVDRPSFFTSGMPAEPVQQPPTTVLWTRGFNKVSGSAIEQIVRHRHANMFAAPIRERDAPGYHRVVLQPQDLKSIKAAISHGNRTAAQAAAALPDADSNKNGIELPIDESLVPPKSIINSGQLDRELAHMFANAVMYNPDASHGPGPEFLVATDEAQADGQEGGPQEGALGYKVDEFGVVKDARAMFLEVDKLLNELRSAEVRRTGGRTGANTGTSTRQASVANREASQAGDDGAAPGHHEEDEHTGTDAEAGTSAKRRRITRN